MAAIDNNPQTTRLQAEQWFKFQLKRAPALSYFAHNVKIPNLTAGSVPKQPTPWITVPKKFDHVTYQPLSIKFQVDADLQNWLEIFNWMNAIAGVTTTNIGQHVLFDQYGIYSDLLLFITDSQYQPKYTFVFENAFPVYLGELDFSSTVSDTKYVECEVIFEYTKYRVDNS